MPETIDLQSAPRSEAIQSDHDEGEITGTKAAPKNSKMTNPQPFRSIANPAPSASLPQEQASRMNVREMTHEESLRKRRLEQFAWLLSTIDEESGFNTSYYRNPHPPGQNGRERPGKGSNDSK